jgi:hypothetical protein
MWLERNVFGSCERTGVESLISQSAQLTKQNVSSPPESSGSAAGPPTPESFDGSGDRATLAPAICCQHSEETLRRQDKTSRLHNFEGWAVPGSVRGAQKLHPGAT